MDQILEKTVKSLKKRQINGMVASNIGEAREMIINLIPSDSVVGIGDSSTVRQTGAIDSLKEKGLRVINPFDTTKEIVDLKTNFEYLFWPSIEATLCDVFLTGTNALTQDGKLMNIDGAGNRVAGMFWGHPLVILVVGKNKIVANIEEANNRVKNVVAPEHVKRKGMGAPCTKSGKCHDCAGDERVCAVTSIIERKPILTEINVIIVNEDLGLSWDRSWPQDRIDSIIDNHEKHMCGCPLPRSVLKETDTKELWKMARKRVAEGIWTGKKHG